MNPIKIWLKSEYSQRLLQEEMKDTLSRLQMIALDQENIIEMINLQKKLNKYPSKVKLKKNRQAKIQDQVLMILVLTMLSMVLRF